jgi:hypothetical protein
MPQAIFYQGQWQPAIGTSLGAPELAGFFAHAAAYLIFIESAQGAVCGKGPNGHCAPIGQPGPTFYLGGTRPFYDVHDGSCNGGGVPGAVPVPTGYCTTFGYDKATGFGSANMLQLAWAINHSLSGHDDLRPIVTFQGPPANYWYGTDQNVTFTISGGTMGVAGFTAQWDHDPGDPVYTTPGAGDPFWDGPSVPFGTSGSLSLASAGTGCHIAFIRAWNNVGTVSVNGSYGPLCFGDPPSCAFGLSCPSQDDNPPDYTISCKQREDFYLHYPSGSQSFLGTGQTNTGASSLYAESVSACNTGTNNCMGYSIFVGVPQWCHSPIPPGPPHPHGNCKACIEAGGICGTNGCTF